MDVSALTLRDIQYLLAVAEHNHFGKAALACHVSQPALSAQIKKVESVLGQTIFERGQRQVRVTPVGQEIVRAARGVWSAAEMLALSASRMSAPMSGILKLAAIATLGPYFWPHVLLPIRRAFPKLKLILREGLTDQLIGLLRAGELDAVLASPTFDSSGLTETPLFFEKFLAVLPAGHALSEKDELQSRDLNPGDMVLLEEGHCLKDQTLDLCPANRRGSIRQTHATSIETLRQLVATGMGYTLLPSLSITKGAGLRGLLEYRPLANPRMGRQICMYSRRQSANRSDLDLFLDVLKRHLPPGVVG